MLEEQLALLRETLLPKEFDASGVYTSQQIALTLAFRVLVHAEFESYVEDRVREVALAALKEWHASGNARKPLIAMTSFVERRVESAPASIEPPQPSQNKVWPEKIRLTERINLCVASHVASLLRNHGVKEENLLSLLLPVGVETTDIDPFWLQEMTSFGALRGQTAHSSLAGKAVQQPDPKIELERIERLTKGMRDLDAVLSRLTT